MKEAIATTIERILCSISEPLSDSDFTSMLSKTFSEGGLGRVYTQNPDYFSDISADKPASFTKLRLLATAVLTGNAIIQTMRGREVGRIEFHENPQKAAICYALLHAFGDETALTHLYPLLLDEKAPPDLAQRAKTMLTDQNDALTAELPSIEDAYAKKQYAKRIYLAPSESDRTKQLGWLRERDRKKDVNRPIPQEVVHWDQENWQGTLKTSLTGLSGPIKIIVRGHANDHLQSLHGFSDRSEPSVALPTMQAGILAALTANPRISFISISILSCCAGAMKDGFARGVAETLQNNIRVPFKVLAPLVSISVNETGRIESYAVDEAVAVDNIKQVARNIFDELTQTEKNHSLIKQAYSALVRKIENSGEGNSILASLDPMARFPLLKDDKNGFFERFKNQYDEQKLLELMAKLDQLHRLSLEPKKYSIDQANSAVGFFSTPHGLVTRDPVGANAKSPKIANTTLHEMERALNYQPKTGCLC